MPWDRTIVVCSEITTKSVNKYIINTKKSNWRVNFKNFKNMDWTVIPVNNELVYGKLTIAIILNTFNCSYSRSNYFNFFQICMKKQIEMHTFSFVPQLVTQNSLSITSQGWCIVLRYGNCGGMHPGEGERAQQVRSPGKQQILGERRRKARGSPLPQTLPGRSRASYDAPPQRKCARRGGQHLSVFQSSIVQICWVCANCSISFLFLADSSGPS